MTVREGYMPFAGHEATFYYIDGLVKDDTMLKLMQEGGQVLDAIPDKNDALLYLINLGQFIEHVIRSGINLKRWFYVTEARDTLMVKDQLGCAKSLMPENLFKRG